MKISQAFLIQYIASMLALGVITAYFGSLHSQQKLTWKKTLICMGLIMLEVAYLLVFCTKVQYPMTVFLYFIILLFVFRQKLVSTLVGTIIYMFLSIAADSLVGITLMAIVGQEAMNEMATEVNPLSVVMHVSTYSLLAFLVWGYGRIRRRIDRIDLNNAARIVRSFLVPASLLVSWLYVLIRRGNDSHAQHFINVLPITVLTSVSLIAAVTYIIQDVRYVRQRRMNSALLEQKKIQDALLTDTRLFRHNIVNLLYGFQGTILSGDNDKIRKYYEQMTATCRMINNENVVALERIPSLPVHTLLLQKIQRANDEKIPFYVYTDENLIWRGMKDPDFCEVLGVLIDNALEAARESAAPAIILEFHNAERDMEVVVRNTCRDIETVFSQPQEKANHEGLGLPGLQKVLKGYPDAVLNIFTQGRFVEANLLLR